MIYITVLFVIFSGILVFVFGFQTVKEPSFVDLTNGDKKQQNKKRKLKEKVSNVFPIKLVVKFS